MAEPHTLASGDKVTHPTWPEGTIRTVTHTTPFKRGLWAKGRYKMVDDPKEVIVHLDQAAGGDDAWMEGGLEKVP